MINLDYLTHFYIDWLEFRNPIFQLSEYADDVFIITALARSSILLTQIEGSEVTLKCPVQPPVGSESYDWFWKRLNEHGVQPLARLSIENSKVLYKRTTESKDIQINSLGNEITIQGLENDDSGVYECMFKETGTGISSKGNFYISVRGKVRQSYPGLSWICQVHLGWGR